MPSEIAKQIVQQIFGDDKAKAVDSVNDALSAAAYDAVQQRKIEFENNIKSLNNKIEENVNVEQKHYPKLTIRLSKQDENNHQEMLKKIKNSVWEKI